MRLSSRTAARAIPALHDVTRQAISGMDVESVPIDAVFLATGGRAIPSGRAKTTGCGDTTPILNIFCASLLFVVAAAEILFQPDIQADEEVTAAHLLDEELRRPRAAVSPGNRHNRPAISADYGLQWKFNGQIEMRR